jgi:hypothetical protein
MPLSAETPNWPGPADCRIFRQADTALAQRGTDIHGAIRAVVDLWRQIVSSALPGVVPGLSSFEQGRAHLVACPPAGLDSVAVRA